MFSSALTNLGYRNSGFEKTDECVRTLQAVQQAGRRVLFLETDVSHTENAAQACQQAEKKMGPIDILVNNAGIARSNTMININEADWTLWLM